VNTTPLPLLGLLVNHALDFALDEQVANDLRHGFESDNLSGKQQPSASG
jgi:hypothetical protein